MGSEEQKLRRLHRLQVKKINGREKKKKSSVVIEWSFYFLKEIMMIRSTLL